MASECKICKTNTVERFISFGKIPLGNAFPKKEEFANEELFEMDIGLCNNCKLSQHMTPPPGDVLNKDYSNYAYVPVGDSLTSHISKMGISIVDDFKFDKNSFFVDIGSNNGTLLSGIKARCRILGVEPAVRISQMAKANGIPVINEFFSSEIVDKIIKEYGNADAATVTRVMQHIPELNVFIADVARLLKDDGIFVIEERYFAETIRQRSYDTVYHEMMYFFTLTSLVNILKKFGMNVFRAELNDVYGGCIRVYADKGVREVDASVSEILNSEKRLGMDSFDTYMEFANYVFGLRNELNTLIKQVKKDGKKIAGYGAPSTSATLLNFCKISNNDVDYVIDDSPLKQGLYTPGTHIPIVNSTMLEKEKPDYILLLAWRLKGDIAPKIKKYGVEIILPLPNVKIAD